MIDPKFFGLFRGKIVFPAGMSEEAVINELPEEEALQIVKDAYIEYAAIFELQLRQHILGAYDPSVIHGWNAKYPVAVKMLNGTLMSPEEAFKIIGETDQTGEDPLELCAYIKTQYEKIEKLDPILVGIRRSMQMTVRTLLTPEAIYTHCNTAKAAAIANLIAIGALEEGYA